MSVVSTKADLTASELPQDSAEFLRARLKALGQISSDFLALLAASTFLATFGLFENSSAVIIGAMIIAPLMRPLSALSMALLAADMQSIRQSTLTLGVGSAFAIIISYFLALLLNQIDLTPEIIARTRPTLIDLAIAISAGAIGAYCQAKKQLLDSLAGVAIAVALVPPLCVVGVGLAIEQTEIWQGALLLYLTNLVGICVSGSFVFLVLGHASFRRARHGLLYSCLLMGLLAVPLAFSLNKLFVECRLNTEVRQILKNTYTFKNTRLRDVEIRDSGGTHLVLATVFTEQEINEKQVLMVRNLLQNRLNMKLDFRIRLISEREIGIEDN